MTGVQVMWVTSSKSEKSLDHFIVMDVSVRPVISGKRLPATAKVLNEPS